MKSILEYLNDMEVDAEILEMEMQILASETIITESFKSSILQKLAKKIFDAEKDNNQREITNKQDLKAHDEKEGYKYSDSWYKPKLVSFASILGPITKTTRSSKEKTKMCGIKWSEITDKDFKQYGLEDKELIKLIKKTYGKQEKSVIIITDKDDNPLNFIKAFNNDPKQDGVFYFKVGNNWNNGVKKITKSYYSYQTRSLKTAEVIDMIKELSSIEGVKAYALEITDEMTQEYNRVVLDRKEAQSGVINYDKESLEALAKQQRARYEVLAKKMKEEKMSGNMEQVWKDIENAQKKVMDIMQEAIKPENMDKVSSMSMVGDLMRNISYAYGSLLEYYKNTHDSKRRLERAKQRAAERGEDFDEDEYAKWNWDANSATREINNVVEYIKNIDKEIERIKKVWENKDED